MVVICHHSEKYIVVKGLHLNDHSPISGSFLQNEMTRAQ
jgi:hypothetical protein